MINGNCARHLLMLVPYDKSPLGSEGDLASKEPLDFWVGEG